MHFSRRRTCISWYSSSRGVVVQFGQSQKFTDAWSGQGPSRGKDKRRETEPIFACAQTLYEYCMHDLSGGSATQTQAWQVFCQTTREHVLETAVPISLSVHGFVSVRDAGARVAKPARQMDLCDQDPKSSITSWRLASPRPSVGERQRKL